MEQTWDVRAIFHFDYHWDFLANQNSTFTFETYCVCKTQETIELLFANNDSWVVGFLSFLEINQNTKEKNHSGIYYRNDWALFRNDCHCLFNDFVL